MRRHWTDDKARPTQVGNGRGDEPEDRKILVAQGTENVDACQVQELNRVRDEDADAYRISGSRCNHFDIGFRIRLMSRLNPLALMSLSVTRGARVVFIFADQSLISCVGLTHRRSPSEFPGLSENPVRAQCGGGRRETGRPTRDTTVPSPMGRRKGVGGGRHRV